MHPHVRKAYVEAGFPLPDTPQDAREASFRRRTKRAKEEDIKKFINQVWRISQGPKKEYIFYEIKEVGPDLVGNEDTFTEIRGRYDMPKFRRVYDNTTGEARITQIAGSETIYEIPYSKGKMEEILKSGDSENTVFTLALGNRKYGGFTREDFTNKSFEELAEMALYGGAEMAGKQAIGHLRGREEDFDAERRIKEHQKAEREAAKEAERLRRTRLGIDQQEKEGGGGEQRREDNTDEQVVKQRQEAVDEALGRRGSSGGSGGDETTKIGEEVNYVIKEEDRAASEEEEPKTTTTTRAKGKQQRQADK
jgi:hypothetical protein